MSEPEPEPELDCYLTVAIRTSRGCGPGVKRLPASEAARIVNAKLGVLGTAPPRGFDDGGNPTAIVAASKVFSGHSPRPEGNVAASN